MNCCFETLIANKILDRFTRSYLSKQIKNRVCHLPRHFKKVEEKFLKMSFSGYNLVQDYEMEDDETDTYIDPRFRTVEPWSNEAIETWKYDRKRKYPQNEFLWS